MGSTADFVGEGNERREPMIATGVHEVNQG